MGDNSPMGLFNLKYFNLVYFNRAPLSYEP